MNDLEIIILAGGKGKRMGHDRPKVLTEIKGQPMIASLLSAVEKFHQKKPVVVLGYKAEEVKKYIGERARYAMQDKQLGTGHAVATALPHLSPESKTVIVFYADHPLIDVEVIQTLYKAHLSKNSPLTLVTIIPEDFQDWRKCFYDYGRIVRDSHGKIVTNVEMKDASAVELEIREVSPSFFCFDHAWLKENIKKIGTQNAQGEYYLTDLVGLAREQGHELNSCTIPTHKALGVNTPEQLELVLQFMA